MKSLLLLFVFFFCHTAKAQALLFDCHNKAGQMRLTVFAVGNYQGAMIVSGASKIKQPAVINYHSSQSAQRNGYASLLGNKVLRIDWMKVSTVNVVEAGDYTNEGMGVIGVEFFDTAKKSIGKGMFFGQSGAIECN
jgi:hypothetical protein